MNTVLNPSGSPCLAHPCFPPFRPQPPHRPSPGIYVHPVWVCPGPPARGPGLREETEGGFPRGSWPGLRTALAGSPVGVAESGSRCSFDTSHCYGPVVHLRQLPTPCCHDAVAFGHRRVNEPPDGDFHPAIWAPSQAHGRGRPRPRYSFAGGCSSRGRGRPRPEANNLGMHRAAWAPPAFGGELGTLETRERERAELDLLSTRSGFHGFPTVRRRRRTRNAISPKPEAKAHCAGSGMFGSGFGSRPVGGYGPGSGPAG